MPNELLYNDFNFEDILHPFEHLGFEVVKDKNERVWMGSRNLYVESKTFIKKDEQIGECRIYLEERKGETGAVSFSRVKGSVILPSQFFNKKGSIKSHSGFWFFRVPKSKLEKYYIVEPVINSIELINLLVEFQDNSVEIQFENGIIKFEFNIEYFKSQYYDLINDILLLIPRW